MRLTEKDIARFLSYVDRTGDCWRWTKGRDKNGYGKFSYVEDGKRRDTRAHRVAFFIATGQIDDDLMVLHRCDNPPCVRPDHLYQGTGTQNAADRDRSGHTARGDKAGNHIHVEKRPRGEGHGRAKLTWDQVRFIRSSDLSLKALAEMHDVSPGAIYFIRKGVHWREAA